MSASQNGAKPYYYVPEPSHWPITGSCALLLMAVGAACWLNAYAAGPWLVLAGFMTHMCVNSTARGAFNLGYAPTVVAAATATRALPGVDGDPVPASMLHSASLAAIADLFAVVVARTSDIPD